MPRRSSKRSSERNTSVSAEVQRLFKQGGAVDSSVLLSLRHKYGDEGAASRVREAFVERHSMIVRRAKKFADAVNLRFLYHLFLFFHNSEIYQQYPSTYLI